MEHDRHNEGVSRLGLSTGSISSNTTTNGEIIDVKNYGSAEFILASGTITDGDYTVSIEEGDDSGLSDGAAPPSDEIIGDISFDDTEDDTAKELGYVGKKRYVRANVVSTGVTTGGTFTGIWRLADARHQPTEH